MRKDLAGIDPWYRRNSTCLMTGKLIECQYCELMCDITSKRLLRQDRAWDYMEKELDRLKLIKDLPEKSKNIVSKVQ